MERARAGGRACRRRISGSASHILLSTNHFNFPHISCSHEFSYVITKAPNIHLYSCPCRWFNKRYSLTFRKEKWWLWNLIWNLNDDSETWGTFVSNQLETHKPEHCRAPATLPCSLEIGLREQRVQVEKGCRKITIEWIVLRVLEEFEIQGIHNLCYPHPL